MDGHITRSSVPTATAVLSLVGVTYRAAEHSRITLQRSTQGNSTTRVVNGAYALRILCTCCSSAPDHPHPAGVVDEFRMLEHERYIQTALPYYFSETVSLFDVNNVSREGTSHKEKPPTSSRYTVVHIGPHRTQDNEEGPTGCPSALCHSSKL